jgi:hypothetical protein
MSKLQLSPNPSGAGIVTLAAPNTASNVTLTLPAVTAELITNSSGVLNIGSGQLVKDASGNLGVGVTPSAWGGAVRALQIGGSNGYVSYNNTNGGYLYWNMFNDGSNNKTIATGNIAAYGLNTSGAHTWFTGTGTTGATSSLTQAMTLDSNGQLGLGITSPTSNGGVPAGLIHINTSGSWSVTHFTNGTSGSGAADGGIVGIIGSDLVLSNYEAGNLVFGNNGAAERARIDSSGNLLVGTTSASNGVTTSRFRVYGGITSVATGVSNDNGLAFFVDSPSNTPPFQVFTSANGTPSATAAAVKVQFNGATGRSINAAGTINASGADYAEYMTKAGGFVILKGDVVGINSDGKLTNIFKDSVSFCVKSTSPSYVGGDTWGAGFDDNPEGLEAARQLVDRIAFAGQVPVNVMNAIPGQFIVPINDNGAIKGEAVSNPTLEQYQIAVGKVIAIESDGRARIIVKVA